MKIKRYTASTMRQAMNLVRREHGDDAVILSTKEISGGVEVIAALDPEIEEYRQSVEDQQTSVLNSMEPNPYELNQPLHSYNEPASPRPSPSIQAYQSNMTDHYSQQAESQHAPLKPESYSYEKPITEKSKESFQHLDPRLSNGHQDKEELHKMAAEIQAMRSLLENQVAGLAWGQLENNSPQEVSLIKKLLSLGIGWDLSQKLVNQVDTGSDSAWSEVLQLMEKDISLSDKDIVENGGIFALVGPTGVGKTTTIAKLASRFVMRNSPKELALVTTDSYKVGAQAQLKMFADLISVPVHVATTQDELYAMLSSFASKKLVLIDTAGMSQKALQLSQQLTSGHQGQVPIKNLLVMSAATQLSVMQQIVDAFSEVVLSGCILTKVDEAAMLGNILTILVEQNLPISYVSNGQRVPEDIEMIRARTLIDQAIVLGQQNTSLTDEQAFRMGMAKEISNAQ